MTVGLAEAAARAGRGLSVPLAVDFEEAACRAFKMNFPTAQVLCGDLESNFTGSPGSPLTSGESRLAGAVGELDILVGGPPCQGHSDLNNHTRRADPKNALYLLMARAAEVLQPKFVVIENVPAVRHDTSDVVGATLKALRAAGYSAEGRVVDLNTLGVPQRRRRYFVLASRLEVTPSAVFNALALGEEEKQKRTLDWAIRDLEDLSDASSIFDTASKVSKENMVRIQHLFEENVYDLPNDERPDCHRLKDHTYRSMYGRLRWDLPAQTITTGFGSMGQGRYVHPSRQRTLTPHEAARIQTFPDWYDFSSAARRGKLATMIGNAVPPLSTVRIGELLLPHLR